MKNKKYFIITILVIGFCLTFLITGKISKYEIFLVKVDDYSPDRKLVVKKNDKEIEFKKIKYIDDIELCDSSNPTISVSDIKDVNELIVVLLNDKEVKAIIKE